MLFLDKKCTVQAITIGMEDGEQRKIKTTIYENISCDFYPMGSGRGNYNQNKQSNEYPDASFEVVLPGNRTNVVAGCYIELIDGTTGSIGTYIVNPHPIPYRGISGKIDNIVLAVTKVND